MAPRADGVRRALLALGLLVASCGERSGDGGSSGERPPAALFTEVAAASGIDFVHRNGATGEYLYPERLHAGAAFLDFDGDGWLDVYLVQSGELPAATAPDRAGVGAVSTGGALSATASPPAATRATGASTAAHDSDRLYRNRGDGTFADVSASAGIGGPGYGTGIAVADYDRDGDVDVYVTRLGTNVLYRNRGDGTFEDATAHAGAADAGYASAAAFLDYDADGDLDLWVVHYLNWSPGVERPCFSRGGLRGYCSPLAYGRPQSDTLFRNDGDGTFTDVSERAGIRAAAATGLGVVTADFDGDGRVDVYVANDQMANHLWLNQGDGTFRDEGLARGCALDETGQAQASMGVVTEDPDDDGDWDLFSVNLTGEGAAFHRNLGGGQFMDATDELRLGAVTQPYTGFGTALQDFDNDGVLDLFVASGKVRLGDSLAESYAEPNLLLRGAPDGGFDDWGARGGPALALREVSRAAAFGDYDNDGDVDILVANNDGPARLLRNETRAGGSRLAVASGAAGRANGSSGARGSNDSIGSGASDSFRSRYLSVELRGSTIDRDGIGALVLVRTGTRTRRRQVQPAYSYAASNDPRVHFGLGAVDRVDEVKVVWADGRAQSKRDVQADQIVRFDQPPPGESRLTESSRARSPTRGEAAAAADIRPGSATSAGSASTAGSPSTAPSARTAGSAVAVSASPAPAQPARPPSTVPRPPAGAVLDPEVAAAIASAAAAVEAAPAGGARWGRLGRVYESAEYFTLARVCYEAAQGLDGADAEWPYHLGRLAAERGEPEAAVRLLGAALEIDPASLPARLRLGDALLRRGDLESAEAVYASVAADPSGQPWGGVGLARVRQRQERLDEARALLERALAVAPLDREGNYLLALIDQQQGRRQEAAERLERFSTAAVSRWPPDPLLDRVQAEAVGAQVVLQRAGRLLAAGDLDAAQPLYEQVLAGDPDDVVALVNLGNVHLRRRAYRRALPLFERATALEPDDPHPRLGLTMALLGTGQRELGLAELDAVLRLDPGNAQARAMKAAAREQSPTAP